MPTHPIAAPRPIARPSRWVATLALLVTLGGATGARGDGPGPGVAAPDARVRYLEAREMRFAGILLTGLSLVPLAMGIYGAAFAALYPANDVIGPSFMSMGFGLGGAMLIPGAILWPLGQHRLNQARAQGAAFSLAPAPPGSVGGGVRLTW